MNLTRPTLEFTERVKKLMGGLSAVLFIGEDLWLACDELTSVERLTPRAGEVFGGQRSFELHGLINLPAVGKRTPEGKSVDQEIDIEGLDFDGDCLWLVGSHSVKRKKADKEESPLKNIERLATVEAEGNRYLLARVPVVRETPNGESGLKGVSADGTVKAAQLPGTMTDNALVHAITEKDAGGKPDPHLSPWLTLPGKDNGLDIEGLVVRGEKVFIGLRGPVLRGWAVVLELHLEKNDGSSELKLKKIGPTGRAYRKHFLDLGGLGVRDLCADGEDLLILTGPTMTLDGLVRVFRWTGGMKKNEETVVWADELAGRALTIPHGVGVDRAEGMALVPDSDPASVIVVYDSPSEERKVGDRAVRADIFELP